MKENHKEGLLLAGKGIGIATMGASAQALTAIGASMFWQIPFVVGFGYLTFSSGRQLYQYFTAKDENDE